VAPISNTAVLTISKVQTVSW